MQGFFHVKTQYLAFPPASCLRQAFLQTIIRIRPSLVRASSQLGLGKLGHRCARYYLQPVTPPCVPEVTFTSLPFCHPDCHTLHHVPSARPRVRSEGPHTFGPPPHSSLPGTGPSAPRCPLPVLVQGPGPSRGTQGPLARPDHTPLWSLCERRTSLPGSLGLGALAGFSIASAHTYSPCKALLLNDLKGQHSPD